jgi:lysyl-tRNA synthetase class 2
MMLTNQHSIRDVLLFPAMKPEAVKVAKIASQDKCKKCGNENMDELKPAKKGKGMFCMDVAACKKRSNS